MIAPLDFAFDFALDYRESIRNARPYLDLHRLIQAVSGADSSRALAPMQRERRPRSSAVGRAPAPQIPHVFRASTWRIADRRGRPSHHAAHSPDRGPERPVAGPPDVGVENLRRRIRIDPRPQGAPDTSGEIPVREKIPGESGRGREKSVFQLLSSRPPDPRPPPPSPPPPRSTRRPAGGAGPVDGPHGRPPADAGPAPQRAGRASPT